MFSVTVFKFSFTSSWKILCLVLAIMSLLTSLGFWQLHRAAEKRDLLDRYQAQSHRSAILLSGPTAQQYQKVNVRGVSRLPITFFLDNQQHAHQFGYDVLTPLLLADDHIVLIDHGWIAGDSSRLHLPELPSLSSILDYEGQVYYPSKRIFTLGVGLEKKSPHKIVIESLDISMISQFLHKPVYPFIIRLSANHETQWIRDWPIVASSPIRHIGYAVQWFIFAFGVGIMYIVLHSKRQP